MIWHEQRQFEGDDSAEETAHSRMIDVCTEQQAAALASVVVRG